MGIRSRRRPSHNRPTTAKRRAELARLGRTRRIRIPTDDDFMTREHLLRCSCGSNLKATILSASRRGWAISTMDNTITHCRCPKCPPKT